MTIKKNKQKAKLRALQKQNDELVMMKNFLEEKWSKEINYTCIHCLKIAYKSTLDNEIGYITDDELLTLSDGKLKHK